MWGVKNKLPTSTPKGAAGGIQFYVWPESDGCDLYAASSTIMLSDRPTREMSNTNHLPLPHGHFIGLARQIRIWAWKSQFPSSSYSNQVKKWISSHKSTK